MLNRLTLALLFIVMLKTSAAQAQFTLSMDGSNLLSVIAACEGAGYVERMGSDAVLVNPQGLAKAAAWCSETDGQSVCRRVYEEECKLYAVAQGYCQVGQSADVCTNGTKNFAGAIHQGLCPAGQKIPDPASCQAWLETVYIPGRLGAKEIGAQRQRYYKMQHRGGK